MLASGKYETLYDSEFATVGEECGIEVRFDNIPYVMRLYIDEDYSDDSDDSDCDSCDKYVSKYSVKIGDNWLTVNKLGNIINIVMLDEQLCFHLDSSGNYDGEHRLNTGYTVNITAHNYDLTTVCVVCGEYGIAFNVKNGVIHAYIMKDWIVCAYLTY